MKKAFEKKPPLFSMASSLTAIAEFLPHPMSLGL